MADDHVKDRVGQVWAHEDGAVIYIFERAYAGRGWWSTLSLVTGHFDVFGAYETHFLDWEKADFYGWTRLA